MQSNNKSAKFNKNCKAVHISVYLQYGQDIYPNIRKGTTSEGIAIPSLGKASIFFDCDTITGSFFRAWTDEKEKYYADSPRLYIPAELRVVCALSTLKLKSGSFVEDDLRQYFSDVLYSLKTSAGDGYIHVLIEHQSSPDKHMVFRLLRYAVATMQRHQEAGHKSCHW